MGSGGVCHYCKKYQCECENAESDGMRLVLRPSVKRFAEHMEWKLQCQGNSYPINGEGDAGLTEEQLVEWERLAREADGCAHYDEEAERYSTEACFAVLSLLAEVRRLRAELANIRDGLSDMREELSLKGYPKQILDVIDYLVGCVEVRQHGA